MAREENDEETLVACEADAASLQARVEDMEFRRMFANPADPNNCFIDIQAGAGGTEACDWAAMLLRQYLRYSERKGFKTEVLEESEGDIAGIKSATIKVEGEYAYGYLRTETGIHRLVRKSPFDSSGGRHTSFSSVFVYPEIDDSFEIDVNPADLRIDTFRASGAGGQHVNKTDSAVRITHLPTGVVVQCQNERSQAANKQTAMRILKSRLAELAEEERDQELAKERGVVSMGFGGNPIRSYVLHPYQLVKDHRTDFEVGNAQGVLDGDLDGFIHAFLLARAAGKAV
jgi:peptide chain release factor 2